MNGRMSEIERAFFDRYAKVYDPEANFEATEEKLQLERHRAEQRKLYPPSRPVPRGTA